uniref:Uncharacterized protein n=1 Tax=Aureoumbra lagunensis TaxID=44058 RepID=A0A6S8EFW2_9STRA|mmetsp:Transcript_3594/g.5458  ORF Transcript_3594/g.5458 Transcript_3594/m.5458 type:complete len:137 (+) Transcript_3594:435-845(+)
MPATESHQQLDHFIRAIASIAKATIVSASSRINSINLSTTRLRFYHDNLSYKYSLKQKSQMQQNRDRNINIEQLNNNTSSKIKVQYFGASSAAKVNTEINCYSKQNVIASAPSNAIASIIQEQSIPTKKSTTKTIV